MTSARKTILGAFLALQILCCQCDVKSRTVSRSLRQNSEHNVEPDWEGDSAARKYSPERRLDDRHREDDSQQVNDYDEDPNLKTNIPSSGKSQTHVGEERRPPQDEPALSTPQPKPDNSQRPSSAHSPKRLENERVPTSDELEHERTHKPTNYETINRKDNTGNITSGPQSMSERKVPTNPKLDPDQMVFINVKNRKIDHEQTNKEREDTPPASGRDAETNAQRPPPTTSHRGSDHVGDEAASPEGIQAEQIWGAAEPVKQKSATKLKKSDLDSDGGLGDRAALVADKCPNGTKRFNGVCMEPD